MGTPFELARTFAFSSPSTSTSGCVFNCGAAKTDAAIVTAATAAIMCFCSISLPSDSAFPTFWKS